MQIAPDLRASILSGNVSCDTREADARLSTCT